MTQSEGERDMARDRSAFDHLSSRERAVVGDHDDYDWDNPIELPARLRGEMVQFSLRVDRALLGRLQSMAKGSGTTVSDLARTALERYVSSGGMPAITNLHVSFGPDPTEYPTKFLVQGASGRPEFGATRPDGAVVR